MMREAVALAPLVGHRKAVFLPGLEEHRDHPVVENVQKVAQDMVFHARTDDDQLGVVVRQDTQRADKAHEVYRHAGGLALFAGKRLELAGRKGNRRMGREMHNLMLGVDELSYGLARGRQPFQQSHGLKEIEAERLALEHLPDFWAYRSRRLCSLHAVFDGFRVYIKILCPARGGHCSNTSLLCIVVVTSWLKLFIDTYKPMKRSSTLANRQTPPPTNCSSSSSTCTRVPRAKLMPCSEITRAKCRALSTLVMPS